MLYISQIIDHYLIRFAFVAKPHCYYDNEVVGWSTSWQGGVLANPSILPIHEYTEVELFERGALFLPIVSPVTFMCG